MVSILTAAVLLLLTCGPVKGQVRIIFDTDFGGDADDLGALAMLHHFMDQGECEILGVMCWSTELNAVPAIDGINRYYGHPHIPVGVRKEGSHTQEWNYTGPLAGRLDHRLTQESARESTELYRQILSDSPDHSVVLVTVGPLKNIENMLRSGPDRHSPLNGEELVGKKVRETVVMGGQFPEGSNEWNFNGNMPGVTRYVLEHLPGPVTFTGYEVGVRIKTGAVFSTLESEHPLYVGFMHFSRNAPWMKDQFRGEILDNASYDQTAVLYAVRQGIGHYWDRSERGYCLPDDKGGNRWAGNENGPHSYLKLTMDPPEIARAIEAVMLNQFPIPR